jgi:hypothetical protein
MAISLQYSPRTPGAPRLRAGRPLQHVRTVEYTGHRKVLRITGVMGIDEQTYSFEVFEN